MSLPKDLNAKVVESFVRVRYAETDAMGIVYHANYLVWMEIGRTDYFRNMGLAYRDLEREYNLYTPLVEAQCRYLAPAFYDDELVVYTSVSQINRRLVKFSYQIDHVGDNRRLVEGETTHLVVNAQRQRASFPEKVLEIFRQKTNETKG